MPDHTEDTKLQSRCRAIFRHNKAEVLYIDSTGTIWNRASKARRHGGSNYTKILKSEIQ